MLILCSIFVRYPLKGVQTLTGLKSLKTIKHGQHGSRNTLQTLDVGRYFRISKQELKACSFGFVSLQLYIYTSSFSISRYFEAIASLCEPAKSWKDEQRLGRCQTRKALRYLPLSLSSSIQDGGYLILRQQSGAIVVKLLFSPLILCIS